MELFDKKFVYLEWDDVLEGKEVFVADTLPELRKRVESNNDSFVCTVERNAGDFPFVVSDNVCYAFVYFDPNYSCKRAYLEGKEVECLDGFGNWILMTKVDPWFDDRRSYRVKPEDSDSCLLIINDHNEVGIVKEGREWKGCLLKKGTEEECTSYVLVHYCSKCEHRLSLRCGATSGCQGFKLSATRRRKTNRELARWLAEGNGQKMEGSNKYIHTTYSYNNNDDAPCRQGVLIRGWDEAEWHAPEVEI